MSDLLSARGQMTVSLAFHILFAVAGMAMPLFMVIAEVIHLRTGDRAAADLAHRWAKGTAILFAVGAVSGTVLSFELGLLWPHFMEKAGPLVGVPFSLEGFAFFLEAIFLGLFLYGRERMSPSLHLFAAVMVAISGLASGVFVMAVNAWMHTPSGFEVLPGGEWRVLDPWAAFKSASFPTQASHMATAAYSSVAFAVLGIHAYGRLSRPDSAFHRRAIQIVLPVAVIAAPLQVWTGDASAKHLAVHQPSKLAAAEGLFQTQTRAPLSIVGWPDRETKTLRFALEIPGALSMLGKGSFDAEIRGLDRVPEDEWPNLPLVYLAFHGMVGAGFAMLGLAGWGALVWARRREPSRLFLRAAILAAPLGLFAVEAGWFVTEVGRYPWIIRGVLKVPQAVTPMPSLWIPFAAFTVLYLFLGLSVVVMLRRHVFRAEEERA